MTLTISSKTILRAYVYSFLTRAFSYPIQQTVQEIEQEMVSLSLNISRNYQNTDLVEVVNQLKQAFERGKGKLEQEYTQLFLGQDHHNLNEGDYDKAASSMSQRLADISAFYLAFGLQVVQGTGERLDFIGAEADFLHALLLKRAHAEQQERKEQIDICIKAETQFLNEHVLWWMPKLAQRLKNSDGFYGTLGSFLAVFLQEERACCAD
jgi:TorA maturation chaperone TorD